MSDYHTIAILGASGKLGKHILSALAVHPLASSLSVRLLTRQRSARRLRPLPDGLTTSVHAITYNVPDAHTQLLRALAGVDVVISVVGDDSGLSSQDVRHVGELPGYKAQEAVARAAKEAGVKLFVPAEYGYPTHTIPADLDYFIVGKRLFIDLLKDTLKLPRLLVYAGQFPECELAYTPLPPCTSSTPKGAPPFETTRHHLAAYIVQLVLGASTSKNEWGIYRILGLRRERLVRREEAGEEDWVVHEI